MFCCRFRSPWRSHRLGLVHRDIKPRNILLGRVGLEYDFAKVLDFGLVKTRHLGDRDPDGDHDGWCHHRHAGPILSPEVVLGNLDIDGRAIPSSLGCTGLTFCYGMHCFRRAVADCARHRARAKATAAHEGTLRVARPAELETIVMELLEEEPAHRIPCAKDLARRRGRRQLIANGLRSRRSSGKPIFPNSCEGLIAPWEHGWKRRSRFARNGSIVITIAKET